MMRNLQPDLSENAPNRPGCGTSPNTGSESRFHPAAESVRPRGPPHHQLRPPGTRQKRKFMALGIRATTRAVPPNAETTLLDEAACRYSLTAHGVAPQPLP